jgi:hypothetical protein
MAHPHRQHEGLVGPVVTEVVLINTILFGLLVWTSAALPSWVDWPSCLGHPPVIPLDIPLLVL